MKAVKTISILLALALLLTGCAQGIPDETTAPEQTKQTETTAPQAETTEPEAELVIFPDAPEQSVVKPLPEKSGLVTAYWAQGLHFGDKNTAFTYYISIPEIYPFSTDAVACQKEIYELYTNRLYNDLTALQAQHKGNVQQLEVPEGAFLDSELTRVYTYTAGVYEDVLSIAVRFDMEETENEKYYVYYLDLATGKRMTEEDAQEKLAVEAAVIKKAVEACYQEMHSQVDATADWYQEQLKKTVSDENINACRVFFTEDGKRMIVARIYTAGSVETVEKLIVLQ